MACFGDTGVHAARELARGPVVGMSEAALCAAAALAQAFSVITLPRRTRAHALRVLADHALKPSPREAYLRTMLAAIDMLRAGITAVQDDAFFVPHPTPEIVDAVMAVYRDVGMRATVALDQPELPELDKLPFLAELLPSDMRAELAAPPAFSTPSAT